MLNWEVRNVSGLVAGYANHPHGWLQYMFVCKKDGRVRVQEYKIIRGYIRELKRSATFGSVDEAKDRARLWAVAFESTPTQPNR